MPKRTATCTVEGCESPYRCTGFCGAHYNRWLKHGDPLGNIPVRRRLKGELCCIEDCGRPVRCKSLCSIHYDRMRHTGRPDNPIPYVAPPCSVEGCDRSSKALGFCAAHHRRWADTGDTRPDVPLRKLPKASERGDVAARILSKSTITATGCHEWNGSVSRSGYGYVGWNRRTWLVHRATWTAHHGPIDKGWTLDHLCYTRHCSNIEHLELVTRAENTMRAMLRKHAGTEVLPEPVLEFLRAASRGTLEGQGFFDQWSKPAA